METIFFFFENQNKSSPEELSFVILTTQVCHCLHCKRNLTPDNILEKRTIFAKEKSIKINSVS